MLLLLSGCTVATVHETRDIAWVCAVKAGVVNNDDLPLAQRYLLTYIDCNEEHIWQPR